MAVNFGLLQPVQPVSAFFQGQQDVRREGEQNMLRQQQQMQFQQQQEDRAFQLQQRRLQAEREAQFDKIAGLLEQHGMEPDDPKVLGQFMQEAMKARNPQLASVISSMAERAAKRRAEREEAAAVAAAMAPPTLPPGPPLRQNAMAPTAPVNALAAPQQPQNLFAGTPFDIGMGMAAPAAEPIAAPAAAPATAQAARLAELERQRSNLESLPRQTDTSRARLASIDREIARLSPKPLQGEAATMQALGLPLTPEGYARFKSMGQRGTPSETEEIVLRLQDPNLLPASRKALENRLNILTTREPKEAKEPNKPVEVVGPDGKPIIVSAEEAISKRMTPAKAMEGLPPKEIQRREADYPKATASYKNFIAKSEQYIKELEKLRDDPGLDSITGTIYGVTPGVISGAAGRRAKAQYDKVFAKGGFQALQDLKAMSPAGGALGNVSNEEGRRLEASTVGGLDRSQDLADVKQGINDYIAEIRGSMKRVSDAYGDTYEYRTTRGAAPAAPPGLSPEDKQALDWANSNPKDPRAAQIKKRLGM
jgi:hypothetical protein